MKRYLRLESKILGGCRWPWQVGHLALALIALVLALECAP